MTLTLGVETSSHLYGVVVLAGDDVVADAVVDRRDDGFVDVGVVVADVLDRAGCAVTDLDRLAVDVGPGNLASVRAGIAYVNALAFARGLPVVTVDSLTLLGREAIAGGWPAPGLALRAGGGAAAYAGLLRAGDEVVTRYGDLDEVVGILATGEHELSVCGPLRARGIGAVSSTVTAHDTGIELPGVRALAECVRAGLHSAERPTATPLTELSPAFAAADGAGRTLDGTGREGTRE